MLIVFKETLLCFLYRTVIINNSFKTNLISTAGQLIERFKNITVISVTNRSCNYRVFILIALL